mgnify:CR=1 FL=1
MTIGLICLFGFALMVYTAWEEEAGKSRKPTAEELARYKAHSTRQDIIMAMTKLQSQGLHNKAAELEKQLGEMK